MKFRIILKGMVSTKRRILLLIVTFLIVIIGAIMLNSYLSLMAAKSNLMAAKSLVENIDQNISALSSLSNREALAVKLQHAEGLSNAANSSLEGSFGLNSLKIIPYVGTQVTGIDSLTSEVNKTVSAVYILLNQVDSLNVSTGLAGHQIPISQLQSLNSDLNSTYQNLKYSYVPNSGLMSPLSVQVTHFDKILTHAKTDLLNATNTLDVLIKMCGLGAPKVYLVVGENNAEMRDQGTPLSYSLLSIDNGKYSLSQPNRITALNLKSPIQVNLSPGTEKVFGELQPTLLWQSTDAMANFNTTGQLMAAMYHQATGNYVDGVIVLDVPVLAELLKLTGPVSIPTINTPITSQNIDSIILHQLYNSVPNNDQQFRRDEVAAVADAILNKLSNESKVNIFKLGETLINEANGRHLLAWVNNAGEESVLNSDGVGGDPSYVDANRTFHVAVENATATKMDYYISESVTYNIDLVAGNNAVVNTVVTVTDNAPVNAQPSYQLGPDNINSFTPGEYVGRAEFWGPAGSEQLSSVSESGLRLNEMPFKVFPGKSITLDMQSVIPIAVQNNIFKIRLVPQSRLYPVILNINMQATGLHIISEPTVKNVSWDKTETYVYKFSR